MIFGAILEFLIVLGLIYLSGILVAQSIKLLPVLFAFSEIMRFHQGFPVESYLELRTLLKMAPFRLVAASIDYIIQRLLQDGLAEFIGAVLGFGIFWTLFIIGILYGLFYVRLRSYLLPPVRLVYNLN